MTGLTLPPSPSHKVLRPAFERVEGPEKIPMSFKGVDLRELWVYRAYDFKGLPEVKGDTY